MTLIFLSPTSFRTTVELGLLFSRGGGGAATAGRQATATEQRR